MIFFFHLLISSSRSDYFRFGSVFIKKNNQTDFFFKKTETGSNRSLSVRFGFLEQKLVQTGLARFFSDFARFFWILVRFGFFGFRLVKPKPKRTEPVDFFKILIGLIGFFSRLSFFCFFFIFSV